MLGCPTSAYSRETSSGAIVLDMKKCIGCRYCQWNCPYDAPKFDDENKIITKCDLCSAGLSQGRQPACSSGCPTGALRFGELSEQNSGNDYLWFPDKKLNPAIEFTSTRNSAPLRFTGGNFSSQRDPDQNMRGKDISGEISLIIFTFLATISVAILLSSVINGIFPEKMILIPVIVTTGVVSFFHLGKKSISWRSVTNLRTSPLSREIAGFIGYTAASLAAIFTGIPGLLIASSILGLVFLLLIDSVYVYSDNNKSVWLHSGQTFISVLLIVSYFSGLILPFLFIAIVKLFLSVYRISFKILNSNSFGLRFLRIAFLVVPGTSLIVYHSSPDYHAFLIFLIFLIGELIDRILFYIDFNPLNINTFIDIQLNRDRDEKKRG